MSVTYSFVCPETKKCIWVGQRGAGSIHPWLYSDENIVKFLNAHLGKTIMFIDDGWFEQQYPEQYEEWKEP